MPSDPPIPKNEAERLAALAGYDVLDSPPEPAFDEIAELAAEWGFAQPSTHGVVKGVERQEDVQANLPDLDLKIGPLDHPPER